MNQSSWVAGILCGGISATMVDAPNDIEKILHVAFGLLAIAIWLDGVATAMKERK